MTTAPALPAAFTAAHAAAARGAAQSFQIEREAEALLARRWALMVASLPEAAPRILSAHLHPFAQAVLVSLGEDTAAEALWACGERTPADFGGDGLRAYADTLNHTVLGMVARAILAR